jgi:DNA-binding transcriptional MerR regulator
MVFTVETTLDALRKFDIDALTLADWEAQLGLNIPTDAHGEKLYSPHHINLFKNVRKHLALGRSLTQIREMITLPPQADAKVSAEEVSATAPAKGVETAEPPVQEKMTVEPAAAQPERANEVATSSPPLSKPYATHPRQINQNGVVHLVEKLMEEKDQLQKRLVETEKLNSHLYNANAMFHRKVKDMNEVKEQLEARIQDLNSQLEDHGSFRFLDEKARIQKQLLDMEKALLNQSANVENRDQEVRRLHQTIADLQTQVQRSQQAIDARAFKADWMEHAALSEILYDNFGINFEPDRVRLFRIAEAPLRTFGNTAVITTRYDYETNPLWKRIETLTVAYIRSDLLEGELATEFILDGVPVAKAIYKVRCERKD